MSQDSFLEHLSPILLLLLVISARLVRKKKKTPHKEDPVKVRTVLEPKQKINNTISGSSLLSKKKEDSVARPLDKKESLFSSLISTEKTSVSKRAHLRSRKDMVIWSEIYRPYR
ncbi:MAG: hypothetical protein JW769_03325 [Parachlamydiales bacterium]|nr:hypothetical protein [Parachlamydiales bacterium]